MIKKIIVFLVLIASASIATSTNRSGEYNSDQTWSDTNVITGNANLYNHTYTIAPGATIIFGNGNSIYFESATLVCEGTALNPIKIIGKSGAAITSYSSSFSFNHCIMDSVEISHSGGGSQLPLLFEDNVLINGYLALASGLTTIRRNFIREPVGEEPGLILIQNSVTTGVIIEDNVLVGGRFTTSALSGTIRGNVFVSSWFDTLVEGIVGNTHEHMSGVMSGTTISRNIFVGRSYAALMGMGANNMDAALVKNNTIDMRGAGDCFMMHSITGTPSGIVFRNNVFMNGDRGLNDEMHDTDEISYLDYNLYASIATRYTTILITGKTPGDSGYDKYALPASGTLTAGDVIATPNQGWPFPYTDAQMRSGSITVVQALNFYRTNYAPRSGSPAINAGAPQDNSDSLVTDGHIDMGAVEYSGNNPETCDTASISYSSSTWIDTVRVAFTHNATITGTADSVGVTPALPSGISLIHSGTNIGRVSGTLTSAFSPSNWSFLAYSCQSSKSTSITWSAVTKASGNRITVGPTGCDYTTLSGAIAVSAPGDTIEIKNGPVEYSGNIDLSEKSNLIFTSSSASPDTINGDITLGDSIRFYNLYLQFETITLQDAGGFLFKNCTLDSGTMNFSRTDYTYNSAKNNISKCTLIDVTMTYEYGMKLINRVLFDSCLVIRGVVKLGANDTVKYCRFYNTGGDGSGQALLFYDDSGLVENNYFNGGGHCSEFLTFQTNKAIRAKNVNIRNNIIDSVDHVAITFDGDRNCEISGNIVMNNTTAIGAIANHQRDSNDSSDNIQIRNNTIEGGQAFMLSNYGNGSGPGPASTNLSYNHNLMTSEGFMSFTYSPVATDTIANCVWGAASADTGTGWGVQANLYYGRTNLVLSNLRYPFLKRNGGAIINSTTGDYAGSLKYLINVNRLAYDIDADGFSVDDSISERFWYDNPIDKDSGTTLLQTATDKNGTWVTKATSDLKKAAGKSTLSATGLDEETKYFYRLVFTGTSRTSGVKDTSEIDSVSTLSSNGAPSITAQTGDTSVVGGTTASLSVTATGTAPITYQWQKETSGVCENIGGATSAIYSFTATTAMNGDSFQCVATNSEGTDTSTAIKLTVTSGVEIVSIVPDYGTTAGGTSVTINGSGFKATRGTGYVHFGSNAASSYTSWADGQIVCVDPSGSAGAVDVTVQNSDGNSDVSTGGFTYETIPNITAQSGDTTVPENSTFTTSVTATGTAPISYQWDCNGTDIPLATTSSYSRSITIANDLDSFRCLATNIYGADTSDYVNLRVSAWGVSKIAATLKTIAVQVRLNPSATVVFADSQAGVVDSVGSHTQSKLLDTITFRDLCYGIDYKYRVASGSHVDTATVRTANRPDSVDTRNWYGDSAWAYRFAALANRGDSSDCNRIWRALRMPDSTVTMKFFTTVGDTVSGTVAPKVSCIQRGQYQARFTAGEMGFHSKKYCLVTIDWAGIEPKRVIVTNLKY